MKKIVIATVVNAAKQPLAELIQFMLTKNPATKNPDMAKVFEAEKANADRYLMGIANKRFSRSPYGIDQSEAASIVMDEMLEHVLTKDNISKFRGDRVLPYLGTILDRSVLNYLMRHKDQKNKVRDNMDTTDDIMDTMVDHGKNPNRNPEDTIQADQLYRGITNYLMQQNRGKELVAMFNFMIEGYSSQEIADKLKVSKAGVSGWTVKLKQYLMEYAKKTNNSHLEVLLGDMGSRRNSATDEMQDLRNVFIKYKKKRGENTLSENDAPAGVVSLIQCLAFEDMESEDYRIQAVQDPKRAQSEELDRLDQINRILTDSGDVAEMDGTVYAIRS